MTPTRAECDIWYTGPPSTPSRLSIIRPIVGRSFAR